MNKRSPLAPRMALLGMASLLLLTACMIGWVSNRGRRPPIILGIWLADDLRVDNDSEIEMNFSAMGPVTMEDNTTSARWSFDGTSLHFLAWQNDSKSVWLHWIRDTNIYAWATGTESFPLTVQWDESKTVMTLVGPEGPRLRLRRPLLESNEKGK